MKYLYFPRFTWIAFCTLLSLTGARGDGNEINSVPNNNNNLNFAYDNINDNHVTSGDSVERNRRALQEIYLIREKKESEDPMNYLSKLYSDMEDSSKSPFRNIMSGSMIEGIVDPPQIELQFHKKVPNCASEFNITKIIELVDDDKRERICPCTCQLSSGENKQSECAMENMQAQAQAQGQGQGSEVGGEPQTSNPPQVQTSQAPTSQEEATTPCEFSAEVSTPTSSAQAGQVAVVSKAEIPGPKPEGMKGSEAATGAKTAEQGGMKAPKPDQTKAAISQKKLEDKQKIKPSAVRPAQQPPAQRLGPPVSRVTGADAAKKGVAAPPRPPGVAQALRPAPGNAQMKNAMKAPQQIANKPLHSKNPELRPPIKGMGPHAPERGKLMNAKQPIANPGWDLVEPGAAYPGLYQFRQP